MKLRKIWKWAAVSAVAVFTLAGQISAGSAPGVRQNAPANGRAAQQQAVFVTGGVTYDAVFGGTDASGNTLGDYTFNCAAGCSPVHDWFDQSNQTLPCYRHSGRMTFDPSYGELVMFAGAGKSGLTTQSGGCTSGKNGDLPEVMEFDGTNGWRLINNGTFHPHARESETLEYDQAWTGSHLRIVMFGGTYGGGAHADTALYNTNTGTWASVTPAHSPPCRAGAASAYDPSLGETIIYGGTGDVGSGCQAANTGALDDAWAYSIANNDWTKICGPCTGTARQGARAAYDSTLGYVVMFGGNLPGSNWSSDTYKIIGSNGSTAFTLLSPTHSPSARGHEGLVGLGNGKVELYGGANNTTSGCNDTWDFNGTDWTLVAGTAC